MAIVPSVSNSITVRLEVPAGGAAVSHLTAAVEKAGGLVTGSAKVDAAVRTNRSVAVLHAREASADGIRKLAQARHAVEQAGGMPVPAYKLFSEAEMGLALGGTNVIHAAVLAGTTGEMVLKRLEALARFRGENPEHRPSQAESDAGLETAKDME